MRTGSTVYPSERNNYSTTKYSDTDSDLVLKNRICNVVQVVIFVVALASVTNVLFLAHNTKSGKLSFLRLTVKSMFQKLNLQVSLTNIKNLTQ